MTKFKVVWDNGASACGTFPYEFDSYEDAEDYGEDWATESNLRDFGEPDPENGYSFDVVEVAVPNPDASVEVSVYDLTD